VVASNPTSRHSYVTETKTPARGETQAGEARGMFSLPSEEDTGTIRGARKAISWAPNHYTVDAWLVLRSPFAFILTVDTS